MIIIVLGLLGYFVFSYDTTEKNIIHENSQNKDEQLREEYNIKDESSQGMITQKYNTYKNAINDAKAAKIAIEKRS